MKVLDQAEKGIFGAAQFLSPLTTLYVIPYDVLRPSDRTQYTVPLLVSERRTSVHVPGLNYGPTVRSLKGP